MVIYSVYIRFWPTLLVCHDVLILAVPPFLFVSCVGLAKLYICTVYDRIYGDFPAKNTVYTLYIYGSGQPYIGSIHTLIDLVRFVASSLLLSPLPCALTNVPIEILRTHA